MAEKFQNKYRIPSARLKDWDYGSNAIYFVTICTHHCKHYFGEITDGGMQLSKIGKFVEFEWLKTPELRPDMNLELGEFVIMPNHFHAIITIGKNNFNTGTDAMHRASTSGSQSKKLASIIRGFKSSVTINARKTNPQFKRQARFHDHIIRNFDSYHRIEQYIQNIPANWQNDEMYM